MESARDLAHAVHLDGVAESLVSDLSHGQQRQLEIGMALSGAPRLILFDEPAAGLSPAERRDLVQILSALPRHQRWALQLHPTAP
jgi:branched-chain amino acid transport system ATP-binding protein